jgi:alanine-glyoxylate transaminase / serine-glyoxylate transaminase / serine-pyruvate transaminase
MTSEGAVPAEPLLLGAGPSPLPDSVRERLAAVPPSPMDPAFTAVMDETQQLLREAFATRARATLPLSASSGAGMETVIANFVDPGDRVVCGVAGPFGERLAAAMVRAGADVERVEAPWGRAIPLEELVGAAGEGCAILAVVHGEHATGVCQPLDGLGQACRERDALLVVDCGLTLGGQALRVDEQLVDAAFSVSHACLGAPPGLAPLTAGDRALRKLERRVRPGRSWYFDLVGLLAQWTDGGPGRRLHHTPPVQLILALHEALRLVHEEWLPTRWERHRRAHAALRDAVAVVGLERLAPDGEELRPALAVRVPDGIDELAIRRRLRAVHGIEIAPGPGPLAGRVWVLSVMGLTAAREPQERLVAALATELGHDPSDALAALAEGWRA